MDNVQDNAEEASVITVVGPDDFIENRRMGNRMVAAGIITDEQRQEIVTLQKEQRERGLIIRFGEMAVLEGFCTIEDVEDMPGYIGELMVLKRIITEEQRDNILRWQSQLREKGVHIRFGEIAITQGIATQHDIEEILNHI